MRVAIDTCRWEPSFKEGGMVLTKTQHIKLFDEQRRKLYRKYQGPYRINEMISTVADRLELPANMKIHPVINVCDLRLLNDNVENEYPD